VLSPLLSNLYLNEVDRMLERAQEVTRRRAYTYLEYARFADDQSDRSRLGELLCNWRCQTLLQFRSTLAGEEDTPTSHAGSKTSGFRLEKVE
jgi:hypothetical protein